MSLSCIRETFRTHNPRGNLDIVSVIVALLKRVLTPSKAAKESSVKRRQLINGMNYYFNRQFRQYKAGHHRAKREDSGTKTIISKVQLCVVCLTT